MNIIIELFLITFLPVLELRGSIPYGIFKSDLHWSIVFLVCVIANILIGIIVFLLIERIIKFMTRFKPIEKVWKAYVENIQKKIQKAVDKYGEWAVAIFIGIPLPGSGVYSGALASYLIGLDFRKFLVANIIGVIIAGIIVTIVCLTGASAFSVFVKTI